MTFNSWSKKQKFFRLFLLPKLHCMFYLANKSNDMAMSQKWHSNSDSLHCSDRVKSDIHRVLKQKELGITLFCWNAILKWQTVCTTLKTQNYITDIMTQLPADTLHYMYFKSLTALFYQHYNALLTHNYTTDILNTYYALLSQVTLLILLTQSIICTLLSHRIILLINYNAMLIHWFSLTHCTAVMTLATQCTLMTLLHLN